MNHPDKTKFGAAQLLAMPRLVKRSLALLVDLASCVLTVWLALCLRYEEWVVMQPTHWLAVAVSVLLALPLFLRFGLYRAIFHFASWNSMLILIQAISLYSLFYTTVFTLIGVPGEPRAVGIIQPMLLLACAAVSRVVVRYWLGSRYRSALERQRLPGLLIYGAGAAGRQLAAALERAKEYRLLGFIDDDDRLWGNNLDGRVVHKPTDLDRLVPELGIADVMLAIPSVSRQRRLQILDALRPLPVHVRTLPGLADLAAGRVSLSDVGELEIEDLLGREPVAPNGLLLNRNIHGKVVLVTGAGGSIGSELCRQILKCQPKLLLLVDMSEFALYQIHQELKASSGSGADVLPLLASVGHEARMHEIMDTWHPHTVYHAAAYKHVPLVEHNPAEGLRNNVWGTWVCAQAAMRHGVQN